MSLDLATVAGALLLTTSGGLDWDRAELRSLTEEELARLEFAELRWVSRGGHKEVLGMPWNSATRRFIAASIIQEDAECRREGIVPPASRPAPPAPPAPKEEVRRDRFELIEMD